MGLFLVFGEGLRARWSWGSARGCVREFLWKPLFWSFFAALVLSMSSPSVGKSVEYRIFLDHGRCEMLKRGREFAASAWKQLLSLAVT